MDYKLLAAMPLGMLFDLYGGFIRPVQTPIGYPWGRTCQSCETRLTPHTTNPENYRECRLCRTLRKTRGEWFSRLWKNRSHWLKTHT